jgi:hypothetical protein
MVLPMTSRSVRIALYKVQQHSRETAGGSNRSLRLPLSISEMPVEDFGRGMKI